ncbi:MAG: hypothetical protein ABIJ09_21510 [Pseudomonadota bacterium]
MRHSRWPVLLVAVALLGVALWIARCDSGPGTGNVAVKKGEPPAREIVYPRQRPPRQRAKPEEARAARSDGGPMVGSSSTLPADALERSVLAPGTGGAVFIELNAISQSALFDRMMRCGGSDLSNGLAMVSEDFGLDLDRDIDRVALSRDVFAVSGYFQSLRIPEVFGEGQRLDARTMLYTLPVEGKSGDAAAEQEYVAIVDQNLLLSASELPALQQALQRLDGSMPRDPSPSLEHAAGELYGELGPAFLQALLEDEADPVAQRLRGMLSAATVRMGIDDDVAMSLDLQATDASQARDLARTVGGALAAWRLQAARDGDSELASLLEQARVQPHEDGRFDVDVAVTGEQILRRMGCAPDGSRLPVER